MVRIDVKKTEHGNVVGFHVAGHAGFAEHGSDIICASISVLVINCINSIEQFSDTKFDLIQNEKDGIIDFTCKEPLDDQAVVLLKSLLFGLNEIQDTYGNEYVSLH